MVTTYYFSAQNPSGIELNRLIASWVIQMSMGINQNAIYMIHSFTSLGKYGDINHVLMRSFNLNIEGENKFMLRKSK